MTDKPLEHLDVARKQTRNAIVMSFVAMGIALLLIVSHLIIGAESSPSPILLVAIFPVVSAVLNMTESQKALEKATRQVATELEQLQRPSEDANQEPAAG